MTRDTEETLKVVAPATLNGGYNFDVTVDGKTLPVTVPPGGVMEGEFIWRAEREPIVLARSKSCDIF